MSHILIVHLYNTGLYGIDFRVTQVYETLIVICLRIVSFSAFIYFYNNGDT